MECAFTNMLQTFPKADVGQSNATKEGSVTAAGAVVLLSGSAVLRFEDLERPVELIPGDWLEIAAHRRHRANTTTQYIRS